MKICDCAAFLRERDNYLLLTHTRPDGDTLCSAAALCSALRRMGKTAWLYPNHGITENFEGFVSAYVTSEMPAEPCLVSIDTADVTMFPEGFSGHVELSIDHHGSNSRYADHTLVYPDKASCGEIVMELIEKLCGGLSREEADLIYAAISTDTGCFCYGNTHADTLRAAARTIEYGADNAALNKQLFRSLSYSRLKLEGLIYAGMKSYRNNTVNIAVITLDMMAESGATVNDCDDLASLPGKVKGSVVAITIRELAEGRSKASVRTNELVNASDICARFGGGGHAMAAGCTVDAGPWELAAMLLEVVDEVWK